MNIYYHVAPPGFLPGSIRTKGSYGHNLLRQGQSIANDPEQEFLREKIRSAGYNTKPSRLASNFVFETITDAVLFRDCWRKTWSIYEVRFLDAPSEVHRVCYTAWDHNHPNHSFQAKVFWDSPPIYSSNTELFAEEDLVVVSEIESNQVKEASI
jgi:hypothetical protein